MALTDISTDHHPDTRAFRAAQYVRMSTEHQQYSTLNQADKILEYAQKRGIEIVRTYADDGKSGLSISLAPASKRPGTRVVRIGVIGHLPSA